MAYRSITRQVRVEMQWPHQMLMEWLEFIDMFDIHPYTHTYTQTFIHRRIRCGS